MPAWHPLGEEGRSGGRGAPEAEGELSVRGEWDGQEGRGGSEIWQGQAFAGQGSLEPTTLDSGRRCSLSCLEKGKLPQLPSGADQCAQGTSEHYSLCSNEAKNVEASLLRHSRPPPSWDE